MTAQQRREEIWARIQRSSKPLSATALAGQVGVSRQIVVGDVALLRAAGRHIYATPRGYLAAQSPAGYTGLLACRHVGIEALRAELYAVVDNGGRVQDVMVENPLYGELTAQLQIASRYDADTFVQKASTQQQGLLSNMTGGVHLHTILCPDAASFARIQQALAAAGVLYQREETE